MLPSYLKCTLQQGQPPLLPYNMEVVEISSIWVLLKSKLDSTEKYDGFVQLYQKRLTQTSNRKVHPREFQETLCKKDTTFPTRLKGQVDA